ncbi:family 16 glycoside hydrolase [Streptomyces sp. M10(2022)]
MDQPRRKDDRSWSDFTLDVDFTIKAGAASVLFRAEDADNYYMWQINTVAAPGKVVLRPHVRAEGRFTTLDEIDLAPVITEAEAKTPHRLRIEADGADITTWIDGQQVDRRTNGVLAAGTLGFRSSTSAGVTEDALYDNVKVRGPDGADLFADDFSTAPDPLFPGVPIADGQLRPGATRPC